MIDKRKQELLDQYDDAAFALLMDEYAEEEGANLLAEFENAMAEGEVPEVPDSLDQKCRQIIHQNYAKQRRKEHITKVLQMTCKAAVVVFVFLGLSATTIMSVDALRIPFLNFLIEHHERCSSINFSDSSTTPDTDISSTNIDPLAMLLPAEYTLLTFGYEDNGIMYSVYQNASGSIITFDAMPAEGQYHFDTEDATNQTIHLLSYEAILITENGNLQVIWMNDEGDVLYSLSATRMAEQEFLDLAEKLVLQLTK